MATHPKDLEQHPLAGPATRATFEGSWVGTNSLGVHLFETATPVDPAGDHLALVLTASADPTFGGLFPTATAISSFHGEAIRSDAQSFAFTKIAVGTDAAGHIVYFLESSGTKVFSDARHFHGSAELLIFSASQDGDGDGWVDVGQSPVETIPYTFSLKRMTMGNS
jgi:hypothetical protein